MSDEKPISPVRRLAIARKAALIALGELSVAILDVQDTEVAMPREAKKWQPVFEASQALIFNLRGMDVADLTDDPDEVEGV